MVILPLYTAYFDDCGTHAGSEVTVLAGYAAYDYQWDQLALEWKDLLARHGIRYYHSVEAAHGHKEFAGRSKAERQLAHREAVEIITRQSLVPFSFSVDGPWFERKYPNAFPFCGKIIQNLALGYCFQSLVLQLGLHVMNREGSPVAMILEESPGNTADLLHMYKSLLQREQYRSFSHAFRAPLTFRSKRECPPLQAADVLAYEIGLDLKRNWDTKRPYGPRRSYVILSEHADQNDGYLRHIRSASLIREA